MFNKVGTRREIFSSVGYNWGILYYIQALNVCVSLSFA